VLNATEWGPSSWCAYGQSARLLSARAPRRVAGRLTNYAVEGNDLTNPANDVGTNTNDGNTTSATVSGLTPSDQYAFTIVAPNALYSGTPSNPSTAVTIAGSVPGSSQDVAAAAASTGSATIAREAPTNSSVAAPKSS
jgi:Fibronectin type III domain